jgi:FG-GAP-like repeat
MIAPLPNAPRRIALGTGFLAVALVLIASTGFPSFELKSKLENDHSSTSSMTDFSHPHYENQPVTIAAADFNGDGWPDVVAGNVWDNEHSNEIALFPGNGDGTFGTPLITKLNARPQQVTVADFNADGTPDVALITHPQSPGGESRLWVFLGAKGGPLKPSYVASLEKEPSGVFLADFDGDGKVDLAVSTYRPLFYVFYAKGDGTFAEPVLACRCYVSLVADFNADHKPDLVVAHGTQAQAAVRINRGNGVFAPPIALPAQDFGARVRTGDLNRDGIPDLLFTNPQLSGLSIYLGNGDGTFRLSGSLPTPEEIHAIAISDLNGDGFLDILATVWGKERGELLIFPGLGNGKFGAPIAIVTGYTPSDIAISDFNLDHKPDLAVSSLGAQSVFVFLQGSRMN